MVAAENLANLSYLLKSLLMSKLYWVFLVTKLSDYYVVIINVFLHYEINPQTVFFYTRTISDWQTNRFLYTRAVLLINRLSMERF